MKKNIYRVTTEVREHFEFVTGIDYGPNPQRDGGVSELCLTPEDIAEAKEFMANAKAECWEYNCPFDVFSCEGYYYTK